MASEWRKRGGDGALFELAQILRAGKRVTFITGAGLSAASGIPTFRGTASSTWSLTSAAKAKRSALLRNPLQWYNDFWLKFFPDAFLTYAPNEGHEAIAMLASSLANVAVVTQNIDGLHQNTTCIWPHGDRLAECHGRLGLYKCVSPSNTCVYSINEVLKASDFAPEIARCLEGKSTERLEAAPTCPGCGYCISPLALMFDEDYSSHDFYMMDKVLSWFANSEALVCVGTSFNVTITHMVLEEARKRSLPVFDFNVTSCVRPSPQLDVRFIKGPSEETLPALAAMLHLWPPSQSVTEPEVKYLSDEEESGEESPEAVPKRRRTQENVAVLNRPLASNGSQTYWLRPILSAPLRREQVRVVLCSTFCRTPHPNPAMETHIEAEWNSQIKQHPGLFNTSKYRLHSFVFGTDRDCNVSNGDKGSTCLNVERSCSEVKLEESVSATYDETESCKNDCQIPNDSKDGNIDTDIDVKVEDSLPATNGTANNNANVHQISGTSSGTYCVDVNKEKATISDQIHIEDEQKVLKGTIIDAISMQVAAQPACELTLNFGMTDYKTFRGTNWSARARELESDGARLCGNTEAFMSQKLGVSCIVETSDGSIMLLVRSSQVSESQGRVDCPGGHPEPSKGGLGGTHEDSNGHSNTNALAQQLPLESCSSWENMISNALKNDPLVGVSSRNELFQSALDEVTAETNIPLDKLTDPYLLGIVRQGNSGGAPTAAFYMQCSLTDSEIREVYGKGGAESWETSSILFLPQGVGLSMFLRSRHMHATPGLEGSLELYNIFCERGFFAKHAKPQDDYICQ